MHFHCNVFDQYMLIILDIHKKYMYKTESMFFYFFYVLFFCIDYVYIFLLWEIFFTCGKTCIKKPQLFFCFFNVIFCTLICLAM